MLKQLLLNMELVYVVACANASRLACVSAYNNLHEFDAICGIPVLFLCFVCTAVAMVRLSHRVIDGATKRSTARPSGRVISGAAERPTLLQLLRRLYHRIA